MNNAAILTMSICALLVILPTKPKISINGQKISYFRPHNIIYISLRNELTCHEYNWLLDVTRAR